MSEEKELERKLYKVMIVAKCSVNLLVWGTACAILDGGALYIFDGNKTVANFAHGQWIYIIDASNQATKADLKEEIQ